MNPLRKFAPLITALAGALIALGWLNRPALNAWAFRLTGEEAITGQARGLAELALYRLTRPPLRLAPDQPALHAGVSPYGINTFLQQEVEVAKREETLRLISEAGFIWIRQEFPWEDIEIHARGDFIDRRNDPAGVDAWAKYDNIVSLAEEYDLQIIARLDNPPAWSRALPPEQIGSFAPPDDYADFTTFAGLVAERYAGRIRYFQVWNEPNIYPEWGEQNVSPEDYTRLLCAAHEAIKQANPEAVVISGALAPTSELSGRDFNDFLFLERMYAAGAADCFDVLAVQGYGLWSGPTDQRMRPIIVNYGRSQFIRDIMVRHGDAHKAIWISEMNWNAAPEDVTPRFGRVTLDQQARWAPLAYHRAEADWPWVGVVNFWYFKRADDVWLSERRPEAYFQMAEPDFTLMPVYAAMQAHTAQPGIMYPGAHYAPHWAAEYGDGWQVADVQASAAPGAEPVTLIFQGRAIRVELLGQGGCRLEYSLDAGPAQTHTGCDVPLTWRGAYGRHTLTITPQEALSITVYRVTGRPQVPPLAWQAMIAALVIGGWVLLRLPLRLLPAPDRRDNPKSASRFLF